MALFEFKEADLPIEVPFRMSVAGSTGKKLLDSEDENDTRIYSFKHINISYMISFLLLGSGKTYFIMKLIDNDYYMLNKEIHKILYFYNILNDAIRLIGKRPRVTLIQGFSMEYIRNWPEGQRLWIIIDDHLVKKIYHEIADLFAVQSNGKDISVTLLTQNLYTKSGNAGNFNREIMINRNYAVFMKCKADDNQIKNTAKSIHLSYHTFMAAYYEATGYKMGEDYGKVSNIAETEEEKKKNAHKYLFFSSTQYVKDELALRSQIFFREENTLVYWPK